jgi:hypothetical protein
MGPAVTVAGKKNIMRDMEGDPCRCGAGFEYRFPVILNKEFDTVQSTVLGKTDTSRSEKYGIPMITLCAGSPPDKEQVFRTQPARSGGFLDSWKCCTISSFTAR